MSVEDGRPYLTSEVNGRTYKQAFNPLQSRETQCNAFVDYIAESEDKMLMNESTDFSDYMFKKMQMR